MTGLLGLARLRCLKHLAAIQPQTLSVQKQRRGEPNARDRLLDGSAGPRRALGWDDGPENHPRCFVPAVPKRTPDVIAVTAIDRSRRQNRAGDRDHIRSGRSSPLFQRADNMRTRLKAVTEREHLFANAFDLLSDGIALLRRDGSIVHVNEALRALAAREKDFRVVRNVVEFSSPELRSRFSAALAAVGRGPDPSAAFPPTDFAVQREDGLPPYTVSVRPLRMEPDRTESPDAVAMMLIHDPLQLQVSAGRMLQELYGLTHAESHLVQALSTGMTAVAYARSRRVSITTVYTHLRRTREKTGWKSVAELTRRFHELSVALRTN
jgi:DNA-binding CsgD family transcriptional regulator